MPRERKPRTWVRLDCEGVLRGSINYLLPLDGQAVWIKMIALSEVCGGRAGFIEDNDHRGLPREYVAQELHCPVELLDLVIERMKQNNAISVNGSGSIELVNFKNYQFSEYDRQKPYRQKESGKPQTFEEYIKAIRPEYTGLDIDKELEKFHLWWAESGKELKRPKSAFRNWLDKAKEFQRDNEGKRNATHKGNPREIPARYTRPEEL